ncbi:MAG: hypothetical protein M3406_00320 [Chloroflexota bacterium]|nr:hypothetical protein [Chloroflexota bacterium]
MARERPIGVHLHVPFLVVPRPWRVGQATFWPAGQLAVRLRSTAGTTRHPVPKVLLDHATRTLDEEKWATVRVRAPLAQDLRGRDDYKAAVAAARDIARDSVAVLTLLKLDRHRLTSTKRQSFGLALDVASVREDYWVTTGRDRMLSVGGAWHGSVGSWDFGNPDIRHYRLDPRFRYLDQALRTPDAARTEWQRRILSGLRTYVTANSGHRPAMRIILAATALEALIGNDFAPGTAATGGHQLARRAAFVWCGAEFGDRHGSQRPICPFLAELNGQQLDQKLRDEAARGVPWTCSYYADLRDLYDDRNAALHGAEVRFTEQLASRHEFTIEQVLFEVLEWVTASGAKTFAQYEGAIGALPEQ